MHGYWLVLQRTFRLMLISCMYRMEEDRSIIHIRMHQETKIKNITLFTGTGVSETLRNTFRICFSMCMRRLDESFGTILSQMKQRDFWPSHPAWIDSVAKMSRSASNNPLSKCKRQ